VEIGWQDSLVPQPIEFVEISPEEIGEEVYEKEIHEDNKLLAYKNAELSDHNYFCEINHFRVKEIVPLDPKPVNEVVKKFSKCYKCRNRRTKAEVNFEKGLSVVMDMPKNKNQCDFCGDLLSKYIGDNKKKRVPPKKQVENEYISCEKCSKIIKRDSLVKHMRDIHEKSNKKSCPHCNKELCGSFSLKSHINAVHNKKLNHVCNYCDKKFANFSNLQRHIKLVHSNSVVVGRYVTCDLCEKLVLNSSLKKHIKDVHDKVKGFECPHCNKMFGQSSSVKEHILARHQNERPYQCQVCTKTFAHKANFTRHMKTVHRNTGLNVTSEKQGRPESALSALANLASTLHEEQIDQDSLDSNFGHFNTNL